MKMVLRYSAQGLGRLLISNRATKLAFLGTSPKCATSGISSRINLSRGHAKHGRAYVLASCLGPLGCQRHLSSSQEGSGEPGGPPKLAAPSKGGKGDASGAQDSHFGSGEAATTGPVKVKSKQREKIDKTKKYTDNVFITPLRAMSDYLLKYSDLEGLPKYSRRSPFERASPITVYLRVDVQRRAEEVWGTLEQMVAEKKGRGRGDEQPKVDIFHIKQAISIYRTQQLEQPDERGYLFGGEKAESIVEDKRQSITKMGSGRVVLWAVSVNAANVVFKTAAWLYTGSHSMFAEAIHSLADTCNQLILAFGLHQSIKSPDSKHPYGYTNMRYISSLISGVGIFCFGTGLSIYHGVWGILHPQDMEQIYWAIVVLAGSLTSECASFAVAINEVRRSAKASGIGFYQYIFRGHDPSVNVVILEDFAAVLGVVVASACLGVTHYTGSPLPDALGSIMIGALLGGVAWFIIRENVNALVGKSIPVEKKLTIQNELENDRMIHALYDVKATEMGGKMVRFKAEVDFDGKEVTRSYIDNIDLEALLKEVQGLATMEEVEAFMLRHGEGVIDMLGAEVDRIERTVKQKYPDVRHLDLEIL